MSGGEDRYAIYAVRREPRAMRRLCETSREGIGLALETMLDEEEIERGWRFGVLDRRTRRWLVNPWA